jgi:hypothetical protein
MTDDSNEIFGDHPPFDDSFGQLPPTLGLLYPPGEPIQDINEFIVAVNTFTPYTVLAGIDCPGEGCQVEANYLFQRLEILVDAEVTDGLLVYPGWENDYACREIVKIAYRVGFPVYRFGMTEDGPAILPRITVIGIAGWAQSGKDTAALTLVQNNDFFRASFADALREVTTKVDPYIGLRADGSLIRYSEAVIEIGYEETKRVYPESRQFLQRLGTEGVRDTLDRDAWPIALALSLRDGARVVIPDVRFENEIEFVHYAGGRVWWVQRPGIDAPPFTHASENSISADDCDFTIVNDGTLIDLARKTSEGIYLANLNVAETPDSQGPEGSNA